MNKQLLQYIGLFAIIGLFLMAPKCSLLGGNASEEEQPPLLTSDPITLEYWRLWDDSHVLDEFIIEYQKDHPNIAVEVKKISLEADETVYDYQSRVIKLIADGVGPDMFMIHNDWLPYMKNQIAPVPTGIVTTKRFQEVSPDVVEEDFLDDNRIYAIPYSIDNLILFYNTDTFSEKGVKQPPRTLADLVKLIPVFTETDSRGNIVRSALPLGVADGIPRAADILTAFMMQYGAEMTSEDQTTATFNLPTQGTNPPVFSAQEALAFYTQFADPSSDVYTYTDAKDTQGNRIIASDVQAFMEEKAAMMIGYGYQIANIQKFNPHLKFDTYPLPQLQLQKRVTLANYWGETVSRNSEHPNEAWDFISFVASRSGQSRYFKLTGRVPAREDILAGLERQRPYGPIAFQVQHSKSWYRKNTPEVEAIFAQMINNVLKNKISTEVAVDTAVRDINNLK